MTTSMADTPGDHRGRGARTFVPFEALTAGRRGAPAPELDVDAELARFEAEERARLGLAASDAPSGQWVEPIFSDPSTASKEHTTILLSGLTMAQDMLVGGALGGLGYHVENLDCPDKDALRLGKEFGNRGQCNPTYFTVGNLVKHLTDMRDVQGLSTAEIIDKYIFLTAGSCGPCRFGMYVTEYRKALRDAGFEGFRVILFEMQKGMSQASGGEKKGLVLEPKFFVAILKALVLGDVINALGYRLRPYEVVAGATDAAVEEVKRLFYDTLKGQRSLVPALWRARRRFAQVQVDRTRVRPKVGTIGEFWAMTTEGDGNYAMQRFLQDEGAEVDVQLVTAWVLFLTWEHYRDTLHRMTLKRDDGGRKGLAAKNPMKKVAMIWAADKLLRGVFQTAAHALGLHGYHISDMQEIADLASDFYNNDLRGGEAHMEVAKVILNVVGRKVNMTLSIKPFGCMPSSGISDGVQSAVTELYPDAIFLPVETTGDGAVNVYSRVQMMLFKARLQAQGELDGVLQAYDMSLDDVKAALARVPLIGHPLFKAPHQHASTAADVAELVGALRHPIQGIKRFFELRRSRPPIKVARHVGNRSERAKQAYAAA
jgi:predicted nucleotide-binding protein (sugar kinase/HSP70/actin superfamily)